MASFMGKSMTFLGREMENLVSSGGYSHWFQLSVMFSWVSMGNCWEIWKMKGNSRKAMALHCTQFAEGSGLPVRFSHQLRSCFGPSSMRPNSAKKHQKLMGQTKNTDCQRMGSIYRWFPLWKPPGGSICRSIGDSPAAFMTGVPICFANLKELVIILPILQENRKPCMENLVTHWDPGTLLPNCFGNLFRNISASAWDVYPKSSMKKCSSDGHNGEQWWPSRFGLGIHRHPKRCFRFGSGFREGSADCLGTRCVNQIFGVPFWNILDDKDRMTPQLMGIYRGRKNGAFPWLPYLKSPAFGNLRGRCFGEIWDTDIHLYILMIPSGNFSHSYWKWPIYRCFTH